MSWRDAVDFEELLIKKYGSASNVGLMVNVRGKNVRGIIPVTITHNHNDCTVSVMWEDAGYEDYSSYELYGTYNTNWQEMEFDPSSLLLTITDSHGKEIELQA